MVTLGLVIGAPTALQACIWDRDTLAMEQMRFPGVLDIMAGDFARHSREYYEWRVARVGEQLATSPAIAPARAAALRDDLAVALHKLGRHEEAVRVMEESLALAPDRYETLSNLGTFTIYTGDLTASRAWLRKALAINPDAHFGREKYQLWLVEHLMLRADAAALPEITADLQDYTLGKLRDDYAAFIAHRQNPERPFLDLAQVQAALTGVTGMMRFADHDNPVLLEALGDLLKADSPHHDAAHLARLAYVFTQIRVVDKNDEARIDAKVARAMSGYDNKRLIQLDELLRAANAATSRGLALAGKIRADEIAWIEAGADVDREFAIKYLKLAPADAANVGAATAGEGEDFRVVFPVRK